MLDVLDTVFDPRSAWEWTIGFLDDPVIGFVLLMGALLLCAALLLGRRPRISVPHGRTPSDGAKVKTGAGRRGF